MPTAHLATLECFPNPHPGREYEIEHVCPEFTSVCPITGQPDFATITIRYVPNERCIELKSLKLYLWSYRNEGAFHEALTNRILDDIVNVLSPRYVRLKAQFNVRGGIFTTVVAQHRKRGWKSTSPLTLPDSGANPALGD